MATFINVVNPPLHEVLEHHGIKGMHWGVRKDHFVYSPRKSAQSKESDLRKTSKTAARKITEITSDPRSAVTFAATAGVGVAFLNSTRGKTMMKTSITTVSKAAVATKERRRTIFKILKGAGKLYIKIS